VLVIQGANNRCNEPGASADLERFFTDGNRPITRPLAHVRHPASGTWCPPQTGSRGLTAERLGCGADDLLSRNVAHVLC
jgi:hypothetical protein